MKKNKVMIIGLGNIGLGINSLNKNFKFLSHAFAIKSCPNLLLDIGIDNNLERRKIFKNIILEPYLVKRGSVKNINWSFMKHPLALNTYATS